MIEMLQNPNVEIAIPSEIARAPVFAERAAHDLGGRGHARGQAVVAEHVQVGDIGQQVARGDQQHAEDQRARQVALRLADFAGDVVDVGPAAVGEQHRHQDRAEVPMD